MDIVMHATMGAVIAWPWLESQPLAAGAFMFGSVMPDLDSLSRLGGKRAFLKCHQRYLHSLSPEHGLTNIKSEGNHTRLFCRDLHHRNFSTTFGNLEIVTDGSKIVEEVFHV